MMTDAVKPVEFVKIDVQGVEDSGGWGGGAPHELYTLNPKPYTLNPKPYTLNPKPYTLNPNPIL
jgi:hypothetical protein